MARRGPKPLTSASRPAGHVPTRDGRWGPPPHLAEEAEAAWRHVVAMLAEAGNLERTDPTLVEGYACNVALMRQAQRSIDEFGALTANSAGTLVANPACAILNAATMRVKAIINDLGLCPATSKYAASASRTDATPTGKWGGLLDVVG